MNLKISKNSFRFKLTAEELNILLKGQGVEQKISMGGHDFSFGIAPDENELDMRLETTVGCFCLHVSQNALKQLETLGRSKEGVAVNQGGIDIALQVDLRESRRKAA